MIVENSPCRSTLEDWKNDVNVVVEVSKMKNVIGVKTSLCKGQQLQCLSAADEL